MNLIHKIAEWSADHIHNICEFTIHNYRRIDATKLLVSKYNTLTIYGTLFNHKKKTHNSNLKSLCDVCSPLLYFSGHRLPPSPRLILIRNRLNTAHGSFRSTLQKVVTFFPEMFPLSASFFFTNPRRGDVAITPLPFLPHKTPIAPTGTDDATLLLYPSRIETNIFTPYLTIFFLGKVNSHY